MNNQQEQASQKHSKQSQHSFRPARQDLEDDGPQPKVVHRNRYHEAYVERFYRFMIPAGSRVLHVQDRLGDLSGQQFDYIILSLSTMQVYDVQEFLQALHTVSHAQTRIIIDSYAPHSKPFFAKKHGLHNWLTVREIEQFLYLAEFEPVTSGRFLLIPFYIPVISRAVNAIARYIPGLNRACLHQWIVARPQRVVKENSSVSVIIPCRNERGNIEPAVLRCPVMGSKTEIIFVEGNSKDGTLDEIKRVAAKYPERNISWHVQDGKGKGDAVHKGFAHAAGDILMILDGDLTVPPEELPKFYNALVQGKGEFINGSRLIYTMENQAMQFLNLIANFFFGHLFSWIMGQKVKDTLCGTKVLWRSDYEKIAKNRSYFGDFDPFGDFDLLFGAAKLNLKIVDMPVHYKNRTYGSTQIRRFYHGCILLYMSFIGVQKFKFW